MANQTNVTNSTPLTLAAVAAIQALPGASSFADCVCTARGYKDRRDGQHHCGCVAGFYEDWNVGTMTCTMCEANHYCVGSDEYALYEIFILATDTNTISISSNGINPSSSTARRLLAYSFKHLYGQQVPCPLHAISGNGSAGCMCMPGYEGAYDVQYQLLCTACPLHTYKEHAGNSECTACPLNSTTKLLAATKVRQCNCGEAFYRFGSYQCELCPANSVSRGTFCECDMGYTALILNDKNQTYMQSALTDAQVFSVYECTPCRPDTYKRVISNNYCLPCREGSANPVNHKCQCMPGWTASTNIDVCVQCEAGKYKHTWGDAVCETCPEFSWSDVGSSHIEDCACITGTLGPAGGPCSVIGDCGSPGCLYTDSRNIQKRGIDLSTSACAPGYVQESIVT